MHGCRSNLCRWDGPLPRARRFGHPKASICPCAPTGVPKVKNFDSLKHMPSNFRARLAV